MPRAFELGYARVMISHATALLLRTSKVSLETLKSALTSFHDAGAHLAFWRRSGFTLITAHDGGNGLDLTETAASLAKALKCQAACINAFTGSANGNSATVFTKTGEQAWTLYSPERASAESRAVEKKLGRRLLTGAQVERMEDSDDGDALDDELVLADLPYWKVHLQFELPGTSPHLELQIKPALEVIGRGWKRLESWAPPLTADEQAALDQRNAELAARAKVVKPAIAKALKQLTQRVSRRDVYGFGIGSEYSGPVSILVASHARHQKLLTALTKHSLILRKSKLARRVALRTHAEVWESVTIKNVTSSEVHHFLSREEVNAHFGPVPFGGEELQATWKHDESDQSANAWNSLLELKPVEVVQVLRECDDGRLGDLFSGFLRDQARELVRGDFATYVPLIAAALAEFPASSELDSNTWMFLEPAAKKLSTNAGYVKALRAIHLANPSKRIGDALAKVGVKV